MQVEFLTAYACPEGEVRLYRVDPEYVILMYHPELDRWKELRCCGVTHALEMFDWCVETIHCNMKEYC